MAYVRTLADFPDSLAEVVSDGVDWAGLERLVEDCDGMPCRTDVLAVLREMPADERLRAIKALCNGRPYRYMYDNLFPALRGASVGVYEVPVPGAHTVRAFSYAADRNRHCAAERHGYQAGNGVGRCLSSAGGQAVLHGSENEYAL